MLSHFRSKFNEHFSSDRQTERERDKNNHFYHNHNVLILSIRLIHKYAFLINVKNQQMIPANSPVLQIDHG